MTKRILYIEDNPENRLLMRRVLMAEGYLFEEAHDGSSGLQKVAESPPDLILIDINLPEIDGYEVTFDFMRGDEDYKYRFGALKRSVVRAVVSKSASAA